MSIARIRVETDYPASALKNTERARDEKDRIFYRLWKSYKRQYDDAGISHDLKRHATFESKSRIKRRKKREAISKQRQETLIEKLLRGERVPGASKLLKKLREEI